MCLKAVLVISIKSVFIFHTYLVYGILRAFVRTLHLTYETYQLPTYNPATFNNLFSIGRYFNFLKFFIIQLMQKLSPLQSEIDQTDIMCASTFIFSLEIQRKQS